MEISKLQYEPVSKVLEKGYINIYSKLSAKEKRAIEYKRRYKVLNPMWADTQVFLAEFFKANVVDNCVVLDAGCGNGNYVIDENREKISWAQGIDTDMKNMEKNVCLDDKVEGNLEEMPFEEGRFDAVVSLWVLEHLDNPQKVFNEINRVLKKDGFFLFCTPNKNYIPLKILAILNRKSITDFLNKHLYGRQERDVFKTYYKANDLNTLTRLAGNNFKVEILMYNYDPSYMSFNDASFKFANICYSIVSRFKLHFLHPHIIGIFKKC